MNDPMFENSRQPEAATDRQQPVRIQRNLQQPIVTYTILGVTVFVYLLQMLTESGILREPFIALGNMIFGQQDMSLLLEQGWGSNLLILLGGKIQVLIVEGQFWRLFTPALLHASLLHIGFNMYALLALGRSLEMQYGHKRFLLLYLLGALGGNTLSFLLSPGFSVGASTAVFGLVAAQGVFIFQNRRMFGENAKAALQNVVMILVINLALGLSSRGIDNWGHLGGLLAGAAFAWFAGPLLTVDGVYPTYELVDKRTDTQAWVVGTVIAAVAVGLVMMGIRMFA